MTIEFGDRYFDEGRLVEQDFIVTCDACGEEMGEAHQDFKDFIDSLREQGWKSVHSDDCNTWEHYCPDCTAPGEDPTEVFYESA